MSGAAPALLMLVRYEDPVVHRVLRGHQEHQVLLEHLVLRELRGQVVLLLLYPGLRGRRGLLVLRGRRAPGMFVFTLAALGKLVVARHSLLHLTPA